MLSDQDPIVAIATAPGRGGIGVVRLSGRDLQPVLDAVLGPAGAARLVPRQARLAPFVAADGQVLDTGLVLLFPAPQSYTGETVVELQGHGGPVVLRMLLARCLEAGRAMGLRVAEPGEFTRRAFMNDRLDLAQAEAVADLIDAATEAAVRSAQRSLAGDFSRAVHALVEAVLELRTLVEATLDFPEEEIDFLQAADARGRLAAIRAQLAALQAAARQGALLRDGLHVVLVGAPNVGKSSLLNALAGADIALVTPIAGTTRDRIAQAIDVGGVPLNIIDTAGVRPTTDIVERLGIERTLHEVERADVVLHLVDASTDAATDATADASTHEVAPGAPADAEVLAAVTARVRRHVPVLTVVNKIDLLPQSPAAAAELLPVSALTGAGLDALRAALLRVAGLDRATETLFLARQRHLEALQAAGERLAAAAEQADVAHGYGNARLELFAEELRLAGEALGSITGAVSADDLLGRIFSRFCIGK
jgi:tRNA modification GTPase